MVLKKILTGAVAALTVGGAAAATATPAAAQYRGGHAAYGANYGSYYGGGYRGYDRGRRDNTGAVIGAGILGLVIGAALTSNHHYAPPPQPAYYAPAYDDGCRVTYRWDPYYRQSVPVTVCD
jgi:hypothetical protein